MDIGYAPSSENCGGCCSKMYWDRELHVLYCIAVAEFCCIDTIDTTVNWAE